MTTVFRCRILSAASCLSALLAFAPSILAQSSGKVPREVIDEVASRGVAPVVVGLKVPWQQEATLTDEGVQSQRGAIRLIQEKLLAELHGKKHTVIRKYEEFPGIALEVGADALADLAQSPHVANVLLDRRVPANPVTRSPQIRAPARDRETPITEKVPWQLFTSVANDGRVLVLAGLKVPWQREEELSEHLRELQRKTILDAQSYILAELVGTDYKVMRLYSKIPGIALRVGPDALKILARSPAVTNVLPDRPARASR
ncbi:MAG TPA: hypothetical protein VIB79_01860 [Candidatus Binatia bacterium]|jgi:hypothetical protein